MVNSVNHYNNVTDTYAKDPVDIRRPAAISFGQFGGCALPQITGQPQGQTIASGQPATLQVSATGTNLTYQWYMDPYDAVARHYTVIPGAISSSYTTSPVYTTRYMVSVTNACGRVDSTWATVTVPPPTAPSNLVASASGSTATLSWSASTGATSYQIERRSNGGAFAPINTNVTGTFYTDSGLVPNTTYVYRVQAANGAGASGYSNNDLASTMTFTSIANGGFIKRAHFDELLNAVNMVLAASGTAPVTWPSGTAPASGGFIHASQLTFLRNNMDGALRNLQISTPPYTDGTITITTRASSTHVRELQDRTR